MARPRKQPAPAVTAEATGTGHKPRLSADAFIANPAAQTGECMTCGKAISKDGKGWVHD